MRCLSLYSGIGGLDLAAHAVGFTTGAFVECDPYCRRVLAHHWPEVPAYVHDTEVTAERLRRDGLIGDKHSIDLIHGGPPCFAAGTMVLTATGYKVIEAVKIHDLVLTHQGRWREVTATMMRQDAPVRTLLATGAPRITTTDEHPFYARRRSRLWNNARRSYERVWAAPEWIEARDLAQHDMVAQVLPPVLEDSRSTDFWWLVGRYLADGWRMRRWNRKTSGRVVICCKHSEADALRARIRAAGFGAACSIARTDTKFHIGGRTFYDFLEPFGRHAHGKLLPGFVYSLAQDKARALVDGYVSGDGGVRQYPAYLDRSVTTTSRALALSIALLAQRAYGIVASLTYSAMPATTTIEGRTVNQRGFWRVRMYDTNRISFVEGNYGWKPVRGARRIAVADTTRLLIRHESSAGADATGHQGTGPVSTQTAVLAAGENQGASAAEPRRTATVYNISVREDESYIADGCIVHNCQPSSCAGKRAGASDSRWRWPEFLRIVGELQPRWVLGESPTGLVSLRHGDGQPAFGRILYELSALGYRVGWGIWSAADVGAPHRRERVFILGRRADAMEHAAGSEGVDVRGGRRDVRGARQRDTGDAGAAGGTVERGLADAHQRGGEAGGAAHAGHGVPTRPATGQPARGDGARVVANPDCAERGPLAEGRHGANGHDAGGHQAAGLADAQRPQRRAQPRGGHGGANGPDAGGHQAAGGPGPARAQRGAGAVAVASGERRGEGRAEPGGQQGRPDSALGGRASGGPCADAVGEGRGPTLGALGLPADGTAGGLPRHPAAAWPGWPARPGQEQYDYEPPRLSRGEPERIAALKALGNAVVWMQAMPLFQAIADVEREEAGHE